MLGFFLFFKIFIYLKPYLKYFYVTNDYFKHVQYENATYLIDKSIEKNAIIQYSNKIHGFR